MEKQIHVNAYTKKDGTQVKEHYRNINMGILPPSEPTPILDEPYPDVIVDKNPERGPVLYANSPLVLEGGVTYDYSPSEVGFPTGGDVFGTILSVIIGIGSEALQIAGQLSAASDASNFSAVSKLMPKFETAIKSVKSTQTNLEKLSKKYLDKLVTTKDQQEYSNLLKNYSHQKELLSKLNHSMAKIDYYKENKNYSALYDELKNYQSNFDEVMNKNMEVRPIYTEKQKNLMLLKSFLTIPKLNLYDDTIRKLDNMPIIDKSFIDNVTKGLKALNLIKDSEELWKAFSHDFTQSKKYIEKNGNLVYSVSDLPTQELQDIVKAKLQQQLGVSDALGVIFKSNSSLSKSIGNSIQFKNFFKANANKLLNGEVIDKSSMHYSWRKNLNLGTALGNVDVLYSFINNNGNLYSIIFDTYDFNKGEGGAVEMARMIQEAKLGRSYYTLSIIIIPLSKWLYWLWF